MDLRHFDPAKLGSVPREWLSPAKMALSIFFDFFKTLYLHQKHIFCKSGNVKLLGLVCFMILRRKIYYTTICFFKRFVFNFSLNFWLLRANLWKHWQSCKIPQKKRNFMKKLFLYRRTPIQNLYFKRKSKKTLFSAFNCFAQIYGNTDRAAK